MAGSQKGFSWRSTTLFSTMKNFDERANKAVGAAMQYQATRSETYMKKNARWKDDTTNARNGLFAIAVSEGTKHKLLLSHGVPYGIWLELAFSGRYAIVLPAFIVATEELRNRIQVLFASLPKGE